VTIDKSNFYPIDKENYERRSKRKVCAHTLGRVEPKQYFGLKESLMNLHAGQLPCPLVVAAEPTTLVFFDKHDFVNVFDSEQITNLLDTVHKHNLINDVQESELILRSMHA
jgi:hypothetical protein